MKNCPFLVLLCGAALAAQAQNRAVTVNRTVPKVTPPKTGLEFSANPTTREISRARVFEEPPVPIGGEPSAEENAALLTCLGLEYYNTAYCSRALKAWQVAWALGQKATDASGKFLADRAVCELAGRPRRTTRVLPKSPIPTAAAGVSSTGRPRA